VASQGGARKHVTIENNYEFMMLRHIFMLVFAVLSFVQVPQWDNDWTKCSVAVPDTACHWYVVNPDNTFGKGFSWITAPKEPLKNPLKSIQIQD
jgi:hypothetical protein